MTKPDDVLQEFLIESHENLDRLDQGFVALEEATDAADRIAEIFRTIHTIKGTAGFLGFTRLEALTHAGESLLSRLRDRRLELSGAMISALLELVDTVRLVLRGIESAGQEPTGDDTALVAALVALTEGRAPPVSASTATASPPPTNEPDPNVVIATSVVDDVATGDAAPAPIAETSHDAMPVEAIAPVADPVAVPAPAATAATPAAIAPVAPAAERASPADPVATEGVVSAAESTVRVSIGVIDKLMNLVGELVLARNQILQCSARIEDATFLSTSQRLNLITTELQAEVMKTRMQPIGNVWSKLPRVVRDLATTCGKQVRVEMIGKETELDRTVLEAIKDPLTHIVRNAVDHGIEPPDDRAAVGKGRTGTLVLRAFHEGGQVNIEIADDGRGLDTARIRAKAVERGVVTAERAAAMGERELAQLVFLPGFSTAAAVTNVSGRGVGMDVVKTNIERIGGTVDLHSRRGQGSTIRIKIPLTLAIVPALVVVAGAQRYAIPQASLLELVRLETEQARAAVTRVRGAILYRLRGNLLPLVHLNETLGITGDDAVANLDDGLNVVVVQADERQFGLIVDEVHDTEEIVVKPLGKELMGIPAFAGATIMGDGRVALILDVLGLAQHACVVGAARERNLVEQAEAPVAAPVDATDDRQTLLLFRVGDDGVMALPLSDVARLEEFPRERVERAGRQRVVQYRGDILPLVELAEAIDGAVDAGADALQVVVHSDEGRHVGVVVGGILDIVEERVTVSPRIARPGVLGAAVIQGRVTDLVDIQDVVRRRVPGRAA